MKAHIAYTFKGEWYYTTAGLTNRQTRRSPRAAKLERGGQKELKIKRNSVKYNIISA
jgi:hypothetical protein